MTDNSFFNCGINAPLSSFSAIINNTVNGKPLVYLVDKSDLVIEEAGQIILKQCSNITVENLELSNVTVGIICISTDHCSISNNLFKNNMRAIELDSSNLDTISSNNITSSHEAIRISNSKNIRIINNNIVRSGWTYLYECDNISVKNNIFFENDDIGIYLQSTMNSIINNNIVSENVAGIFLECVSNNNIISGNEISKNEFYGIQLALSSDNNIIIHNNLIKNFINAFFRDSGGHTWDENYWDNWIGLKFNWPIFQKLPKLIFGFPGINFDRHPAREPYDIGVG